jgi:hypothetical protein
MPFWNAALLTLLVAIFVVIGYLTYHLIWGRLAL